VPTSVKARPVINFQFPELVFQLLFNKILVGLFVIFSVNILKLDGLDLSVCLFVCLFDFFSVKEVSALSAGLGLKH
jgi:hypothetical protein